MMDLAWSGPGICHGILMTVAEILGPRCREPIRRHMQQDQDEAA